MEGLKEKIIKGLAWRSLVDISQLLLQIVFTAILARLLSRADFGLVAMALLVNRFAVQMTRLGYGAAIIQDQNITDGQISAIFIIQSATNFVISVICFFAAPLACSFFGQPALKPVLQVIVWLIFLDSFNFPQILLQKKLQFKGYSLLQIIAMTSSNAIGIAMALTGFGVWALVFRLMIQRLVFAVFIWPMAKWKPVIPTFKGVGRLSLFGFNMLASKICRYFSQNLASIVIGKYFGVETLGSFNIAYNLAISPATQIQSILTSVLTPAFSKIQTDADDFRNKFHISLYSLGLFFIPIMLGLSAVAPVFIICVYGQKWKEAGLFLTFLAFVGLLKGFEQLLRSVIVAKGWPGSIFRVTLIEVIVSAPLLYVGSYFFQVIGLILAYLIASIVSSIIYVIFAQKAVDGKGVFIQSLYKSVAAGTLMFLLVRVYSTIFNQNTVTALLSQIALGVSIYTISRILLMNRSEKNTINSMVSRLVRA